MIAVLAGLLLAVPVEIVGRVPVINVTVNGQGPFRFLLDTGATDTIITPPTAAKLGLTARPVGVAGWKRGTVQSLACDDASVTNLPVYITDPPQALPLRLDHGLDYHGLLGHDFLARFVLTLDYRQRTASVTLPGKGPLPAKRIPVQFTGGGLTVPVTFDNQRPVPALLDTGSAEVVLFPRRPVVIGFATANRLAVGEAEVRDVPYLIHQPATGSPSPPAYAAILGAPFLSRFRVTIHYPGRYLLLEAR